jgi:hypothetical protein
MGNRGHYVASLGRLTRCLAEIAESKAVQVYPGFIGHSLLYEGGRVVGLRTADAGVDEHGKRRDNYQPGTDIRAPSRHPSMERRDPGPREAFVDNATRQGAHRGSCRHAWSSCPNLRVSVQWCSSRTGRGPG